MNTVFWILFQNPLIKTDSLRLLIELSKKEVEGEVEKVEEKAAEKEGAKEEGQKTNFEQIALPAEAPKGLTGMHK